MIPFAAEHNKILTLGKYKTKVAWYHTYLQPKENLSFTQVRGKGPFDFTQASIIASVNVQ